MGRNKDGRLQVLVAGGEPSTPKGYVYHIYQNVPNNGWTEWNQFIRRRHPDSGRYISPLDYYRQSSFFSYVTNFESCFVI